MTFILAVAVVVLSLCGYMLWLTFKRIKEFIKYITPIIRKLWQTIHNQK